MKDFFGGQFKMRRFLLFMALSAGFSVQAQERLEFASGSWYNPARDGEGFVVQVLPDDRAVVTWFTYPPAGEDGSQAWMIGSGTVDSNRILIEEMVRPMGATFGPDFDPADVERQPWGTLEIAFADCNTATANWAGPAAFGSGSMDLTRISSIDDVGCAQMPPIEADRIIAGRSGPWYDPAHDGEGWMVEILPDGRAVVYWFTYDDQGRQTWMIGAAAVEGRTLWIEDVMISGGTRFGDDFNTADVVLEPWGSLGFLFEECAAGKMRYDSSDERFGAGALVPLQINQLAATDCTPPPPAVPLSGGTWRLSTETDSAFSESASAATGGYVYTGGGYSHGQRLQRFDQSSESYSEMPEMPGSRHHPMMASDGRDIYLAGGFSGLGQVVASNNFWRFRTDVGAWEMLPNLPNPRAAGAAVYMHGHVFIVGGKGIGRDMQAWEIETGRWKSFPGNVGPYIDHMQAVVFENEIWWMGGRSSDTTNRVSIWNPVTREWRDGPPMNSARSGFAARVVQGQIMVAGGEILFNSTYGLVESMEVFAPGADAWVFGPRPPVSMHGNTGASNMGTLVLTAGSDIAGQLSENRATQIYTPASE